MQRPRHAPTHHVRTRHATETWAAASGMHARVVGAVIMRDLQTRFGTGYFGFLLGLLIPLGHLTVAIAVTTILGRPAPIGTDVPIFLMTGVLPFIIWLYGHRQIMQTMLQNRPLLHFPGVDVFDLFLARIIVEIVTSTLVVLIVMMTLSMMGHEIYIANPTGFLIGLALSWLLGVSTGLVFGILGTMWSFAFMLGNVLGPLMWVASGVLFLADGMPNRLRDILIYNPLAQIIDGLRVAYFSEYWSSFYDPLLLGAIMLSLTAIGMALVPVIRKFT